MKWFEPRPRDLSEAHTFLNGLRAMIDELLCLEVRTSTQDPKSWNSFEVRPQSGPESSDTAVSFGYGYDDEIVMWTRCGGEPVPDVPVADAYFLALGFLTRCFPNSLSTGIDWSELSVDPAGRPSFLDDLWSELTSSGVESWTFDRANSVDRLFFRYVRSRGSELEPVGSPSIIHDVDDGGERKTFVATNRGPGSMKDPGPLRTNPHAGQESFTVTPVTVLAS